MSTIKSSDEHLTLNADGSSKDIKFQANGVEKASISSAGVISSDGGSTHADNVKAKFGTGNDLEIYHDGTDSYIHDSGTGNLELRTNGVQIGIMAINGSEYMGKFVQGNQVELYYNNSKKFETTSSGVTVTGATNSTVMPTFGGVDIVAHGSNSNGNYFKFADGTMICTVSVSTSAQNNGPTAGGFYYSNGGSWTYPVAFTGSVRVIGNTEGGHWNAISVKTLNVGNSSCTYATLSINSNNNAQGLYLFAIGVWN